MNTTALITWASSWIWKELAIIHAEKGGNLVLVARREEKLLALKHELEKKHWVSVEVIAKDLTEVNAAQEVYQQIKKKWIQIDYLVNNAGFGGQGVFYERVRDQDQKMIQLNILTLTELTRRFLPDFVERNSGKILQVSSTASFMPGPLQAVYFATKAYVQSFSNAIAYELHDTNITVTNLMPGATETEFAKTWWLEKTSLFAQTVTARSVAEEGYDGMIQGKIDVISGLSFYQKLMFVFMPFIPKQLLMKEVYKMQVVKKI